MTIANGCVAAGATPFVAVMLPAKPPATRAVPLMTPVNPFSVKPGGSEPVPTANVGVGLPKAVSVKAYEAPKVPFGGGVLVNSGAWVAAVFISAKFALAPKELAITAKGPAIPFAVNLGAVATPKVSVVP